MPAELTTKLSSLFATILLVVLFSPEVLAQTTDSTEWRSYGGDLGHRKYAPLEQINRDNVHLLEEAWTWTSVDEDLRDSNAIIR